MSTPHRRSKIKLYCGLVCKIPYRRARAWPSGCIVCSAFRPSARASKGILHTNTTQSNDPSRVRPNFKNDSVSGLACPFAQAKRALMA